MKKCFVLSALVPNFIRNTSPSASNHLEQGIPTFLLPCTPSAF